MAAKKKTEKAKAASAMDVLSMMGKIEKNNEFHNIELEKKKPEDFLSMGSLTLDLITGGGGYGGQVIQFYGAAHCGKSTLGYSMAAWLSKMGIPVAIFDHEGTTDRAYTEKLGVNYDMVRYYRPKSGEEAFRFITDLCNALPDKHSGYPQAAIIVDTIAAMKPQAWIDNPDNKQQAVRAAMHSKAWSQLQTLMTNKHVSIIALNQVRSSAGAMYTSPEVLPGGAAWAFATGVLVRQSRGKTVELPNGAVFQEVKWKTQKNKNFIPQQEAKIWLELGEGFDIASDVNEFAKMVGYFYKRGKGGKKVVGKGLPTLRGLNQILMDHDDEVKALVKKATEEKRASSGDKKAELTEEELTVLIEADGDYASQAKFEEHIRAQGKEGRIARACRIALKTGIAIDLYRKSKDKTELDEKDEDLISTKKTKNTSVGEDSSDDDDEDDDYDD